MREIAELIITDGTEAVSLLDRRFGFKLRDWRPTVVDYKGGGVFRSSSLSPGSRLVHGVLDDVDEAFEVAGRQASPDIMAGASQRLLRLLQKANTYWTTPWQDDPVWVYARGRGMTSGQYGLIKKAQIPELANPFFSPFIQAQGLAALETFNILIRRDQWQLEEPGTGTALPVTATNRAGSRGQADGITTQDIFGGPRRFEGNVDNVYRFDSSLAAWSANIVTSAPVDLFPAGPGLNDALFIGSTGTPEGPFCNLIFNLIAGAGTYTLAWEYWNGGTWAALPNFLDRTDRLRNAGRVGAFWSFPTNWAVGNLQTIFGGSAPNVAGFWVRVRISAFTSMSTIPRQTTGTANGAIYIVNWNGFALDDLDVPGDLPALFRLEILDQTGSAPLSTTPDDVRVALRSVSRDVNGTFDPIHNWSQESFTGWTCSASAPAAFAVEVEVPAGEVIQWAPGGAVANAERGQFFVGSGSALDYYGRFRIFLRIRQVGGLAGDFSVQLRANMFGVGVQSSDLIPTPLINEFIALDMGVYTIPGTDQVSRSDALFGMFFEAWAESAAAGTLQFVDLILWPVDEWAGEFFRVSEGDNWDDLEVLDIDGFMRPKSAPRALVRKAGLVLYPYRQISQQAPFIHANADQRLYIFAGDWDPTNECLIADPWITWRLNMSIVRRYLGYAGAGE